MSVCDKVYKEVKLQREIMGNVMSEIGDDLDYYNVIKKYVSGECGSGKKIPLVGCEDIGVVIEEMDIVWAHFRDYIHNAINRLPIGPYATSRQTISYAPLLDSVEQLGESYGRVRDLLPEIVQKTGKEIKMTSDLDSLCTIVTSLENLSEE